MQSSVSARNQKIPVPILFQELSEETEMAETLPPLLRISLCSYLRQCVYLNASVALAFILLLPRTIMKSFEWGGDSWPVWLMHTPVSAGRVA